MKINKETLKLAYTDFWPEWKDENFITPLLEEEFNVEIDNNSPDVVFYSIFGDEHLKYNNALKILYVGENIRGYPYNNAIKARISRALNAAHYKISFEPHSDTNFRLPLWQVFLFKEINNQKIMFDVNTPKTKHESFERFCSFIVSNGINFFRNGMFEQLSQYKTVHSYGKYRNNSKELDSANGDTWREKKLNFLRQHPHKFMIAYENTPTAYYCTEKLMDAFLVGSIPIYWGDPKVEEDWNPKAFINAHKYSDVIKEIKNIDKSKERFDEIYNARIFTDDQWYKHTENMTVFNNWLIDIIKR